MENAILFYAIQTAAAIILLVNKIMLRKKKYIAGWGLGLLGMILITALVYYWKREMYIAHTYNITLILINLYGFITSLFSNMISEEHKHTPKIIISIGGSIVCAYIFLESPKSVLQNWFEIGMTLGGVIGTICMATERRVWAWRGFMFTHFITFFVFANKGIWIVAILQVESLRQAWLAHKELQQENAVKQNV